MIRKTDSIHPSTYVGEATRSGNAYSRKTWTPKTPQPNVDVNRTLQELCTGRERLARTPLSERIALLECCITGVLQSASEWVAAACRAKGIPDGSPCRAEEVVTGPVITVRYLRLAIQTLAALATNGSPKLPRGLQMEADGRVRVPIMPVSGLYDPAVFIGFHAHARMQKEVTRENIAEHLATAYPEGRPGSSHVSLVLGAGNVSGIPATDMLARFVEANSVVLLKLHPVNDYLEPMFRKAFAPLIEAGFLRIITGGADVGACAAHHPSVDHVHITGSFDSHDAIVWGLPGHEQEVRKRQNETLLGKPISSELGNVSPWLVVPGAYSTGQLRFQAENIAASVVNNAGFNCASTRVLLTWKRWPERERFLDMIDGVFSRVPPRKAYYPGASDRYRRLVGETGKARDQWSRLYNDGTLPWTLLHDVDPRESPQFVREESFVCVCAEVAIDASTVEQFLSKAVDFANSDLRGSLCAAITVPRGFRRGRRNELFESCLRDLRYGTVAINQWPGVAYATACVPWGGYPGGTLADPQSGIGWAHNPYLLTGIEKSVVEGPLAVVPKPIWHPTFARPEPVAWNLLALYGRPTVGRLMQLTWSDLKGAIVS